MRDQRHCSRPPSGEGITGRDTGRAKKKNDRAARRTLIATTTAFSVRQGGGAIVSSRAEKKGRRQQRLSPAPAPAGPRAREGPAPVRSRPYSSARGTRRARIKTAARLGSLSTIRPERGRQREAGPRAPRPRRDSAWRGSRLSVARRGRRAGQFGDQHRSHGGRRPLPSGRLDQAGLAK